MEQQDYLKRQIDQLGRVLGKIIADFIKMKNEGQATDGIEMSTQSLKREIDLDVLEMIILNPEEFINVLKNQKNFDHENLEKLAEIFSLIAVDTHNNQKEIYQKCLLIYEFLEKEKQVYSLSIQWKIQQIKKRCL